MARRRVYIAYTGGTIGMRKTADGYRPAPGFLQEQMAQMPELRAEPMPDFTIGEYAPLIDSSNMSPRNWFEIGRDLVEHYDDYDGFVVLHGTDTMAYTASALPFLLQGFRKPVILTGSQIPLCEVRNDARENLITTLLIAAHYDIPEVCLYFGTQLLRGCRSVKVNADGFDAFASPNFPALGSCGIDITINHGLLRAPHEAGAPAASEIREEIVAALRLFPGISAALTRNVLQPPLRGLVLEAFGVGNGPDMNAEFLAALKEATDRGVVIVDCTQCLRGTVDLGDYATGSAMAKAGVISGYDMTAEAALAKLFYLLSVGYQGEEMKRLMQTDLRGELTVPG